MCYGGREAEFQMQAQPLKQAVQAGASAFSSLWNSARGHSNLRSLAKITMHL